MWFARRGELLPFDGSQSGVILLRQGFAGHQPPHSKTLPAAAWGKPLKMV
jgi:hypothetical protein